MAQQIDSLTTDVYLHMHMKKVLFIVLAAVAASCQQKDTATEKAFFDLEEFASTVSKDLQKQNPSVDKFSRIGQDEARDTVQHIDWSKELELLKQSDLNKAAYRNAYQKIRNGNELSYTLNFGEDLPVKMLVIRFDNENKVSSIATLHTTKNYLYSSEKELSMNFSAGQLNDYEIRGWQELFIGGKKEFEVTGKIIK
jgi:hypothetical protein